MAIRNTHKEGNVMTNKELIQRVEELRALGWGPGVGDRKREIAKLLGISVIRASRVIDMGIEAEAAEYARVHPRPKQRKPRKRQQKNTILNITETSEDSWDVVSSSGNTYHVWDAGYEDAEYGGGMHCDCPAGKHGRSCKHIEAVMAQS
jgi:hypothetical protein